MEELIRKHFPSLNDVRFIKEFASVAEKIEISSGNILMDYGRRIERIPLLFSGSVQVFRRDEEGREVFLYYLSAGDACAISLVCSGRDKISRIRAETIEDSYFLVVPIRYMDEWMMRYKVWYYYVLETYSYRFEEVLKTLDVIAFGNLDDRLRKFLEDHAAAMNTNIIQITHQQIADALYTSREVISRLLKQLENKGVVRLERNRIEWKGGRNG